MTLFAQSAGAALGAWDWGTLVAYFAILLGLAWWVVSQKNDSSKDYFLAGKKVGWLVIGASIFASNIGSEHLVGLAGTGASDGMAMAHYELHAWCLLVLGWVMVPFYERSRVFTTPEFLERRYSPSARWRRRSSWQTEPGVVILVGAGLPTSTAQRSERRAGGIGAGSCSTTKNPP